jgi:hypothetical protein
MRESWLVKVWPGYMFHCLYCSLSISV